MHPVLIEMVAEANRQEIERRVRQPRTDAVRRHRLRFRRHDARH